MKILTILGARPQFIKAGSVSRAIALHNSKVVSEEEIKIKNESRELLFLFTASTVAIGLMYGGGLFYGARTHISIMEFWRWWVVHLWVEGFFEVFTDLRYQVAYVFEDVFLVFLVQVIDVG